MSITAYSVKEKIEADKREYIRGCLLLSLKYSDNPLIREFYFQEKNKAETSWQKIYDRNLELYNNTTEQKAKAEKTKQQLEARQQKAKEQRAKNRERKIEYMRKYNAKKREQSKNGN